MFWCRDQEYLNFMRCVMNLQNVKLCTQYQSDFFWKVDSHGNILKQLAFKSVLGPFLYYVPDPPTQLKIWQGATPFRQYKALIWILCRWLGVAADLHSEPPFGSNVLVKSNRESKPLKTSKLWYMKCWMVEVVEVVWGERVCQHMTQNNLQRCPVEPGCFRLLLQFPSGLVQNEKCGGECQKYVLALDLSLLIDLIWHLQMHV